MAYTLKLNGTVIISLGSWSPAEFAKYTNTSFPNTVDQNYVWVQDGYWLGWEENNVP